MRVYERKTKFDFDYPEDMEQILDYLNKHGEILVREFEIERLYRQFSDQKYCAGWMCVTKEILEEFENWLELL